MRRATLLVADRNPRFLEKTAEILDEAGHNMIAANDGQAARLKLTAQLDGILVHAALPGLSGYALCRLAKEKDPTLPVVIMFSAEDEQGEAEARRAGADNWLVRPLKRLELLYVVRDLMSLRSTQLRQARTVEERNQAREEAQASAAPAGSRLMQFELFKRLLGIELKRSQRYGFPLSILLASLDKELVDGDHDLLAAATRSAIRDIDIPVAFAESDVLVVMPHTDLDGAKLVAERIRKRVRAQGAGKAGGGATASIGVVAVDGGQRPTGATARRTPIIPISEIRAGMKGYGLTVFQGVKPERFDVRVISVLHNFLPKQDIILVQSDDPRLIHSGIVAGMSGSPIYIEGRLAGALAYGWHFAKDPIAGVTPIEAMQAELKRPLRGRASTPFSEAALGPCPKGRVGCDE